MTSIDDLFKKPGLPNKRKREISHDPNEYYKKSTEYTTNGNAQGKSHVIEEAAEEDEDVEAGPTMPPEDEEADDDDEEGRFFGGGVDKGTAAAMDFLDEHDKEETFLEEKYDVAWVRKLGLNFEKRISKNQELRAKWEDEPQKFMASEADLDTDIKALSILSEHPELYEEFVKLGCMESLVTLIGHENTDIAIDAIEIISELLDEDVDAEQDQWDILANAALDSDLLSLLISILSRFDESQDADRSGAYNSLSILESLASQPTIQKRLEKETKLFSWLLERMQKSESPITQNKQYAAEVTAILLQSSSANRQTVTSLNGADILLQLLAPYRRRDPAKDSTEEEYVEDVFDALTCVVDEVSGKSKFVEAEGVELALIMLRDGKMSKSRALRLLDHAVGGAQGTEVCEKLVECQGLKTVFGMFMKKLDKQATEHLVGIFAALLRCLPADSAPRIRVLAKFMEKEYEKIDKLVDLRRHYKMRLELVDNEINRERDMLDRDGKEASELSADWFSRRLDAGLYCLQTIDVVLAWLMAEDSGARKKVIELLAERDETVDDIDSTLKDQINGITDEDEEAQGYKEMLGTLRELLK